MIAFATIYELIVQDDWYYIELRYLNMPEYLFETIF